MPRAKVADLDQQTSSSANSFPGFEGDADPPVPKSLCHGCSASMRAFASLTSLCSGQIASCPNRRATCLRSRRRHLRHPCLRMTAFSLGDPSAINRRTARWPFPIRYHLLSLCTSALCTSLGRQFYSSHGGPAPPFRVRLHVAAPSCEPDWPMHRRSRLVPHYSVSRLLRETLKGYVEGSSSHIRRCGAPLGVCRPSQTIRRCCRRPQSERCR